MNRIYLVSDQCKLWYAEKTSKFFEPLGMETPQGQQILVKKVSSCEWCIWLISSSFKVYAYVYRLDTPLEHQEVIYHNQRRFNLLSSTSFGNMLLPTDRYRYSNADGTVRMNKDEVKLPTSFWSWQSEWRVDQEELDGGWEYAVDFPARYYPKFFALACVRRRKWMRTRAFNAYNQPIPIVSPSDDSVIVDLSVGGWTMKPCPKGFLSVWIVTSNGQLFFRRHISHLNVEGSDWSPVDMPPNTAALACSCSQAGDVCVVADTGVVLLRGSVSSYEPAGLYWHKAIEKPYKTCHVKQLAFHADTLWAVDAYGRLFLHDDAKCDEPWQDERGTDANALVVWRNVSSNSVACVTLSMTGGDVLVVDADDNDVYYWHGGARSIVSSSSTGNDEYKWRKMSLMCKKSLAKVAPDDVSTTESSSSTIRSLLLRRSPEGVGEEPEEEEEETPQQQQQQHTSYDTPITYIDEDIYADNYDDDDYSTANLTIATPVLSAQEETRSTTTTTTEETQAVNVSSGNDETTKFNVASYLKTTTEKTVGDASVIKQQLDMAMLDDFINFYKKNDDADDETSKNNEPIATPTPTKPNSSENTNMVPEATEAPATVVAEEKRSEPPPPPPPPPSTNATDDSVLAATQPLGRLGSFISLHSGDSVSASSDSAFFETKFVFCDAHSFDASSVADCWSSGGGGGSLSNAEQNDAMSMSTDAQASETTSGWHSQLVSMLRRRNLDEFGNLDKIASFYQNDSWRRRDELQLLANKRSWIECVLEIKNGPRGDTKNTAAAATNSSARLILTALKKRKLCWQQTIELKSLAAVTRWTQRGKEAYPLFALLVQPAQQPVVFLAPSKKCVDAWLQSLTCHMCSLWSKQKYETLAKASTLITVAGFAHLAFFEQDKLKLMTQIEGHFAIVEKHFNGTVLGVGGNGKLWMLMAENSLAASGRRGSHKQSDELEFDTYENQRWNALARVTGLGDHGFASHSIVPTDPWPWSDRGGSTSRHKKDVTLPSALFAWSSSWEVDMDVHGGVDKNGWQYAFDYSYSFHAQRQALDLVRRRRWRRTCRITTSGSLWCEIEQKHRLTSLAIDQQTEHAASHTCLVMATDVEGFVLAAYLEANVATRLTWMCLPTDEQAHKFRHVSIGASVRIWAVDVHGVVFFRLGRYENVLDGVWEKVQMDEESAAAGADAISNKEKTLRFRTVACGSDSVWAVSTKDELYFRENVTKSFPVGTSWTKVDDLVKHVSVDHRNQVYCISSSRANVPNQLLFRLGVSPRNLKGKSWLPCIQMECAYFSSKGNI